MFTAELQALDEPLDFLTLHYSDDSLFNFLNRLDKAPPQPGQGRRVVMAFGLEQLPPEQLKYEIEQLNLRRERIFERNLILVFWLNRATFLDEFRNRAADFWEWRGRVATFTTRPPLNPLLYPYLEWLITENSRLKISGVMQVNRQVDVFLDQIYVSLQGEWVEARSQTFQERVTIGEIGPGRAGSSKIDGPDYKTADANHGPRAELRLEAKIDIETESTRRQRVTKVVDLADAVRKHSYSVILGDPGAGKTTLLRYLARHFAIARRDRTSTVQGGMQEDLGESRLPILFRIADYAERLSHEPELTLVDYLRQFYRQWEHGFDPDDRDEVADLLLTRMAEGSCLLLLDGLDEVFDRASRVQVVQQIDRLVNDYWANKFVITSRVAGYQAASLGSRFREFTIIPMGESQIQQFLRRWCLAVEASQRPDADAAFHQREAEREAQSIVHEIESNPGVKRFAANPLLLTILALIHRNGTTLPQRRVELYKLAAKTLIEDWQLGRNVAYKTQHRELRLVEEEVTELLAPLAFWMHETKPSGRVSQADVETWMTPQMAELQGVDDATALDLVRQFLRKVRETTGLFVERSPEMYGFMHLTFEEYFAARHIADNEIDGILKIISPYRNQARWNEPILLALGYLSENRKRINSLVERLFSNLADYQPMIVGKEIRLKNPSANPVLTWYVSGEEAPQESETVWQDLLFAGQVLSEVRVKAAFCQQQVDKLVLTYIGLDAGFNDEPTQELLKLLRGIEIFTHQVWEQLKQAAENDALSTEQHNRTKAAMLYVTSGEAGELLAERVADIVQQLTPSLFKDIRDLVVDLGMEMAPNLERSLEAHILDAECREALKFVTALSYLRADHFDQALGRLQTLADEIDHSYLEGYIEWAMAIAYEKKDNYEQGLQYYQHSSEKLKSISSSAELFILWRYWGVCHRSHKQYEQSLVCLQQALAIAKLSNNFRAEANILWNLGKSYQAWGKYAEAIRHHEQSRDRYQQLGMESDVASQWSNLADCYRDWGQYEQALAAAQRDLAIHQKLNDQSSIAFAYSQLGCIYQAWGKYAEAIRHYEQGRDLYQQLSKETFVVYLWLFLAVCYREWGKYEQALAAAQQELAIRQKLDDQPNIADAYYQQGRIYQAWGKYAEAIRHHEQSRDLYGQLGKEVDVANQWYWIGDCYRDWEQYERAVECQQQCLELRQKEEDRSRVAISLYQLGRIYRAWGKYAEAIRHYEQSRDLYEQLGKETNIAALWSWLADCYREWGKYAKAIRHCEQSRDRYQQLGKEANVANQWQNLSDCYREWGKYEQALAAAQQGLAIRQKLDDPSRIALAYYRLGRIYQAWGKYAEAIRHYEQSRDLYEQLYKETDVADLWFWLSNCYREWGKYEQALAAAQQDLAIRQKLDDLSNIADAYDQQGRIYQSWGKYAEAIRHHEQSRDLYEQLGKESNIANQWYNLANCYRRWGKYEQALAAAQQDLDIRKKLDDQPNIAGAYYQLGHIYQSWGKYAEAICRYEQSRDLYEQLGKESNVADQWYKLADCYQEWGQYKQALAAEQRDLAICQKLDDQPRIAPAYYQQGRIYQAWGKYAEAICHYEQSLDFYQKLGKEADVANQLYWLADCYREWGKYDQALAAAQQDLAIRQKLDDQSNIALAYYQQGRIYQAWGKYAEAIRHYEQSRDFYEQLGKERNVADQWYWLADCYRAWGQYEQALAAAQQDLTIRQKLDDQSNIALAYYQQGRIYQAWGKYAEAIRHHEQSRDRYEQLGKETNVANQWYNLAHCYREWGKYEQALAAAQQDFAIRQKLDDQSNIADAYYQLGRIYQAWGKYAEAIRHHEQSRDLYEEFDLQQRVANQLSWLGVCYRELKNYTTAIKHYQNSFEKHQALEHTKSAAIRLRQLSNTQRLQAKDSSREEATLLLQQADSTLQQAIQLNTAGDYRKNLVYDQISLALLIAEQLRWLSPEHSSIPDRIAQFEQAAAAGFARFTELGQTISIANEALDIARAYLEIAPLENFDKAETLARQSLQTFKDFNRRKLEAAAHKLLGEIYLARARCQEPDTSVTANEFLTESLRLYRELDLTDKANEVEQLMA